MRHLLAYLSLVTGCQIVVDNDGTLFQCDPDGECPSGYTCVEDRCLPVEAPGSTCTKAVAAGYNHTCAIREDDTVWCWGRNDHGQVGDGSTIDRVSPQRAGAMLVKVSKVVTGGNHSCAIVSDGTVSCWGYNMYGQLGDGGMADARDPELISGLHATELALGALHTCAIVDGNVQCWGRNNEGQLGDNTMNDHVRPQPVPGLAPAKAIAARENTTCAVLQNGDVQCWGNNRYGQLGDGSMNTSWIPVPVKGVSGAVGIVLGTTHACVFNDGGQVLCWGNNGEGELGDGTGASVLGKPAYALVYPPVKELVAGSNHTCALDRAGGVWCWGYNMDRQVGDGTVDNALYPVRIDTTFDADGIAAGDAHTCVHVTNSSIRCVGRDTTGQLGDGMRTTQAAPIPISGLTGIKQLAAGGSHTCALGSDKIPLCWGSNGSGELGDGSRAPRGTPEPVVGLSSVAAVTVGGSHTCAALDDGQARCWGFNNGGQLGNNTYNSSAVPVTVFGLDGPVKEIAAGGGHTCALLMNGGVRCWGYGTNGQLGNNAIVNSAMPVAVTNMSGANISGATSIATGTNHTCAVVSGGVMCWGQNNAGQLGDGAPQGTNKEYAVPITISGVTKVAAEGDFTCALKSDQTVWCWGPSNNGVLGNPAAANPQVLPIQVLPSPNAMTLSVGAAHSCVIKTDGTLACWGNGSDGRIGDGTYTDRTVPASILGLSSVSLLAAGGNHTCVMASGGVSCWGGDYYGQLGDGVIQSKILHGVDVPCP